MTSNLANKAQKLLDPSTKLIVAPAVTGGQGLALTADSKIPREAVLYKTYTPVWTGSVTNPVIGNGTLTGRWTKIGQLVHGWFLMIAGSTTTFGSGTFSFTLPVSMNLVGQLPIVGSGHTFQNSTGDLWTTVLIGLTSTTIGAFITATGSAYQLGTTNPFTYATSDQIKGCFTFEALNG